MLLSKWAFLVTLWVLIISHGYANSGEALGYGNGMPSPTACVNGLCYPLLSPSGPPFVSGYPSYRTTPPPPPPPLFVAGYPSYGTPPPPPWPVSGYPSYRAPPPPPPRPVSGYPSYGRSPPPPSSQSPPIFGYPSYGAPPPPPRRETSPSTPGQGCSPPPPAQCCLDSPPVPYEYIPNQNYSAASAPVALSWFSVMVLSLSFFFALLLL